VNQESSTRGKESGLHTIEERCQSGMFATKKGLRLSIFPPKGGANNLTKRRRKEPLTNEKPGGLKKTEVGVKRRGGQPPAPWEQRRQEAS